MSKRDWIIAVALGLILLLAIGISGYQLGRGIGELRGEREARADDYAEHTSNQIQSTCLGLDAIAEAECVERIVEASNENQRAEYELIAQTEMSKWAFWMLWVTLLMALITAVGVIFVWRTLLATQKMASDTREIGEAQVRAYLEAGDIICSIDVEDGEAVLKGYIKNSGLSPCKDVEVGVRIIQKINDRDFRYGDVMCGVEDIAAQNNEEFLAKVKGPFLVPHTESSRIIAVIVIFGYDVFGKELVEQSAFVSDDNVINAGKHLTRFYGRAPTSSKIDLAFTLGKLRDKKRQN